MLPDIIFKADLIPFFSIIWYNWPEILFSLSAPPPVKEKQPTEISEADALKNEEESFFNQTAPTEKERAKLTKDNIMALYGSAPSANSYTHNYTSPQPKFPLPQSYQTQAGFTPPAGGLNQFQPYYQPAIPNQFQASQVQYSSIPVNGAQAQFTGMGLANQFPAQNGAFAGQSSAGGNPFFGAQPGNVHQQFANLSLGKATPPSATPLATNIWQ